MKALDQSIIDKKKFEFNKQKYLPGIIKHEDITMTVKNPNLTKLGENIANKTMSNLNNSSKPGNPELKYGKTLNTERLIFESDEYFWTNKTTVFAKKEIKGGGGAQYNKAKILQAKRNSPQKEPRPKLTYRDEPTLDYKGRINDEMFQFYPGL